MREVNQLLRVIFTGRRQSEILDLEAIEMLVRSAMHQAGAAVLTKLLCFPIPAAELRTVPCACGQQAQYRELRSKPVLTAVGRVEVSRPYYLCLHCHNGQFPANTELDIDNTELSPGVRRMQAVVGQEARFDHGRQPMKLLADPEVTAKSVERTAEAIGENIADGEQHEMQRTVQLDLRVGPSRSDSVCANGRDGNPRGGERNRGPTGQGRRPAVSSSPTLIIRGHSFYFRLQSPVLDNSDPDQPSFG